ncbi:hypothetical protein CONPUDRAFT_150305 [Coniophora puteana RWD-64-598 SS2]|uniref:F-box domain-containing protein n=1 Tax=Coniophora puteana (strain RWD-64-598) TaxID=741705 RepID=A0A5M3N2F9_CONPW|nr:uncharacterized protein CONPUDRAFT_150305 [Coniophora puteana RWD-64-598 SS2]EIW85496.1 hypothetical protein CONPUDRAFT_150305 [Coniophora puteana RWD-64-598 SS2]
MHRALLISEVARNITYCQSEKKALAALAQTCRAFSEPALDALWRELDSLLPLLECLGNAISRCPSFQSGQKMYGLSRVLLPTDWIVFRKYASKVVELKSITPPKSSSSPHIDDDVFRALCWPPTFEPLFPKLQRLICPSIHSDILPFLRFILGPSITSLIISPMNTGYIGDCSLEASLPTLCPRLKHLEWKNFSDIDEDEDAGSAFISEAVTSLTELETLVAPLNGRALQRLSSLPSLRSLDVTLMAPSVSEPHPALHEPAFPSVYRIRFTSYSLSDIADFVRTGHFSLAVFSAQASGSNSESFDDLCTAVSSNVDNSALKFLDIMAEDDHFSLSESTLKRKAFQHLLQFHNLVGVCVDTAHEIQLDNASLLQMAESWPVLESLEINPRKGWGRRSCITLHGLRTMLKRLPKLTTLAIAIDAQAVKLHITEDDQYGQYQITRPFKLNVLDSRIGCNHAEVAAFLSDLFPVIDKRSDFSYFQFSTDVLEQMDDDWTKYCNRWNHVLQTLLVMNRVIKRKALISGSVWLV